jgi:ribosomal protein S18 acetylase RimI-like enzyme
MSVGPRSGEDEQMIVVPDPEQLARAVRTFRNTDSDPAYLESPGTLIFVAVLGDELVGWCWGYRLIRPDNSSMLYLHQLEVVESHRGQGIGRELLTTFMTAGKATGATKMFLTTGADNTPARKLYESAGGGLATQGPTVNYWFLL